MIRLIAPLLCVFIFSGCSAKLKRLETASLHYRAAQELFLKNENIQALSEAKKSEELNKKDPQVQNFLGILYAQIEEMKLAEVHMRKAVDLDPEYSEARLNLCGFLMKKNIFKQAQEHCLKAAQDPMYPNAERAYHNLGWMYQEDNKQAEAIKMYKKALLHNKNFVLSLLSLGKIHYRDKAYDEAEKVFVKADEACMSSAKGAWGTACPDIQYHLALTSFHLKKKRQAISALKHCIETDPEGTWKKKCYRNLKLYQ